MKTIEPNGLPIVNLCGDDYDLNEIAIKADEGDIRSMGMFVNLCMSADRDIYDKTRNKWFEYIKKLAAMGNTYGYIWMADLYERGDCVKKDIHHAILFFQKAAEAGEKYGYECIAKIYYEGRDIEPDYEKAYKYIMKSRKKSGMSYYILGELYREGRYVKKNRSRSRLYYRKARGGFFGKTGCLR